MSRQQLPALIRRAVDGLPLVVTAILWVGCAEPASRRPLDAAVGDDAGPIDRCADRGVASSSLISGEVVTAGERARAIGAFRSSRGECTATLVAPDVAITAAHCVEFKSCAEPACALDAVLELPGRRERVVEIGSLLGRTLPGADVDTFRADIALVRLAAPIEDRAPLPLARPWPAPGEALEVYGLGCADRCEQTGGGVLQRVATTYGRASSVICPGDSGGPVLDAEGRVLRVISGFRVKSGDDFYADVVTHRTRIDAQLALWAAQPPATRDARTCAEARACGECAEQRDCGFCARTGVCLEGAAFGPLDEGACPADAWVWNAGTCEQPGALPVLSRVPTGACESATDCAACTRLAGCGWAASSGTCVRGTASGPRSDALGDQLGWAFSTACCPAPATPSACGDGRCDSREGCATCPSDCGACPPRCGDGVCDPDEGCADCLEDCVAACGACAPTCGDGLCDSTESCGDCARDCGACTGECGDGVCDPAERCTSCARDCGACAAACGDGTCEGVEDCETCPRDCGMCAGRCGDGRAR